MAKVKSWTMTGWAALAGIVLLAGCETSSLEDQGTVTLAELQGAAPAGSTTPATTSTPATTNTSTDATTPASTPTGGGTTTTTTPTNTSSGGTSSSGGQWPAEITGSVKFLHTDVSSWPVTTTVSPSISGGTINFPYGKSKTWPAVDGVNANPWVFVKWTDGQWYAATFEWLRHGQTSKPKGVLDGSKGDHIKKPPLNQWRPKSGERIGIMVSGLARTEMRNVKERSNVVMVTWP